MCMFRQGTAASCTPCLRGTETNPGLSDMNCHIHMPSKAVAGRCWKVVGRPGVDLIFRVYPYRHSFVLPPTGPLPASILSTSSRLTVSFTDDRRSACRTEKVTEESHLGTGWDTDDGGRARHVIEEGEMKPVDCPGNAFTERRSQQWSRGIRR